ncbi:alpha-amylase [Microdochium trichocladiopsis]|uniref:Alpha-amylase n=1 Tax=Microdochium trichocladiopsis TaxID=1682393 RepID=A0A9P8XZF5_9PEZI|nr:alpha-amylase [Microdochium trichocladiopsis]KAH7024885.1 alpha-amylase [Microdochium trichocladiopsis]
MITLSIEKRVTSFWQKGDSSTWWKDGVIYQVYIPSFKDSNGDGYGDLKGLEEKLDYLAGLGVSILWLSPVFESPMHDMGFDISDYYKINPLYGDMEDFDRLLEHAHEKGLKIVLDIALNHSSDENEWFRKSVEAHAGEANEFKDFYMWADPIIGEDGKRYPPCNWESTFGGSMWEYVPAANKYYLHVFGRSQPDLNWENPAVRQELWKVLRFWLDKGVDGFRLDAINCTSKAHNHDLSPERPGKPTASGWPDAPVTDDSRPEQKADPMFANGPKAHDWLHEMYEEVFAHYDAMSLGEMSCGISCKIGPDFISRDAAKRQLDLILHFEHVELDCVNGDKWVLRDWKLPELKAAVTRWQTRMIEVGGWDTIWMENHDQPRGLGRFFKDNEGKVSREQGAKLLAVWLFTLQGTVIIFQGQELGMTNPQEFCEDMVRDIETRLFWNASQAPGLKGGVQKLEMVKRVIMTKGRDTARIPIPWTTDDETSAGFTSIKAKPWLPHHPHFRELCAESQTQHPGSIWTFYHDMIRLRKQHPVLAYGDYTLVDEHHLSVFAYTRAHDQDVYLVVLNFSTDPVEWDPPLKDSREWTIVISTSGHTNGDGQSLARMRLEPYEGIVFQQKNRQAASCNGVSEAGQRVS